MAGLNKSKKNRPIVVAVSGGFDPIHMGHVRLFNEAKKLGDKLVVILNNDYWLKHKKGYAFINEKERKEIIESIYSVDEVIITKHGPNPEDRSVCRELEELKPDVFANGGDRFKDNIPEVEVCNRIGCKMVFNVGDGGKVQSSSWLLNNYKKIARLDEKAELLASKSVILFDLDGTLTLSKCDLDEEMAGILHKLLDKKTISVIGGGGFPQFKTQFLDKLKKASKKSFRNLYAQPTSGAEMYKLSKGKWGAVYKNNLPASEKKKILSSFSKVLKDVKYIRPKKTYGVVLEDRGSQITFSPLGQKAPLEEKNKWKEMENGLRQRIKKALEKYLPEFEVRIGGGTSIDITQKGIDKAYGIHQLSKILKVPVDKMAYVGDALFEGGNDYAAVKTGIDTVAVENAEDTKYLIRQILKDLSLH
ncbi:MAG: HAD-IIB family hydrolase [Patescibacteria group bacterium]|nr:HAD-IIB family hydrolase [Patescibacteria group bacterium]